MKILIGCETSGVLRRAFAARGHEAWSCDLLPAEDRSNRHITGDIRDHLHDGWDLLAVMHPPCTRLCNSGVRWLHRPPRGKTLPQMWAELDAGAALFSACWRAEIPRVAIENPVMHRHARERLPADLPRPQIVQPWWFGEPFFKATGFYLRGLPPLRATDRLTPPRRANDPARHAAWSAIHRAPPGPDRWKIRSRTFEGLAEAAADQWGNHALQQIAA
ncbi:hypothetical protein KM176_11540 [Pseudooceanicola sp. CBS1P-1]|uniref:DNA cytosine methyltransferase n=1 Tax=Pseudooceanicola albus TaxID=2692189 RepID=A0A6L7GAI9_9RHOB|nr:MULTISPECIES: hypothetical protein [Pseudooceanicola]MBT9384493.1 hypothetical protein [Pseudooceanicola endophyticus]MXN20607.1 hypothetical protein [Pseudooceanicola albus]